MPTREQMHSLAQEVIRSYTARTKSVAHIRRQTRSQLSAFDRSHQTMARQQRADLAKGRADLTHNGAGQLTMLHSAREAMARELRADLARGHGDLTHNVAGQLTMLHGAREAMARELRADLAKGRMDLATSAARHLNALHTGRQATARDQRAHRARERSYLVSTVTRQMKEVAATRAGAQREWQTMAATLRARRARGLPAAEAPTTVVMGGPDQRPAEEGQSTPGEAAPEAAPQAGSHEAPLRNRVFGYLANQPDGTRLVDLEWEFGLNRVPMVRVLKTLMDEGKVEKRGTQYFAI